MKTGQLQGLKPVKLVALLPLEAVNVMITIFPKIDSAMMPDMTRGAAALPKTSLKNSVAMSRV